MEPCIGGDEAGKGDLFGPLVVVVAYGAPEGVRDSKALSDRAILKRFEELSRHPHVAKVLMPEEYNKLYARFGNLNKMLAHLYREALDELKERLGPKAEGVRICIDRFGPFTYPNAEVVERAESKCPCAALASMLARAYFLKGLRELEERHGVRLHKGAAHIQESLKTFLKKHGPRQLAKVAKMHFKTVKGLKEGKLTRWLG